MFRHNYILCGSVQSIYMVKYRSWVDVGRFKESELADTYISTYSIGPCRFDRMMTQMFTILQNMYICCTYIYVYKYPLVHNSSSCIFISCWIINKIISGLRRRIEILHTSLCPMLDILIR